jgi:hypothetical protein
MVSRSVGPALRWLCDVRRVRLSLKIDHPDAAFLLCDKTWAQPRVMTGISQTSSNGMKTYGYATQSGRRSSFGRLPQATVQALSISFLLSNIRLVDINQGKLTEDNLCLDSKVVQSTDTRSVGKLDSKYKLRN